MQSGKLRHKIEIQEKSVTRNSLNEEVVAWVKKYDAWANIRPVRAREFVESRMTQAEITSAIDIRFRSGITPEMRVLRKQNQQTYDIEAVLPDRTLNHDITLLVSENAHE